MATPDIIPTDLTLDLGGDIAPEEFLAAVRSFFGYVSEITEAQKGDGAEITWTVRVREGSSLIGVEPDSFVPSSRLSMIYRQATHGLAAAGSGNFAKSGLSEKAVGHLKNLSDLALKHGNGNKINLWVKKKPIPISGAISIKVQEDWDTNYHDFGVIEGRLEAIQDASGSIKIGIKDILFPRAIKCVVPEKMIDQVLNSFRRRVEVEGRIHYRKNGTPISIEADAFTVLPEDDELPDANDVRGIMASI